MKSFTWGFGINVVVVILISPVATGSGFGGIKNSKPSCVAGGTQLTSGLDPARN